MHSFKIESFKKGRFYFLSQGPLGRRQKTNDRHFFGEEAGRTQSKVEPFEVNQVKKLSLFRVRERKLQLSPLLTFANCSPTFLRFFLLVTKFIREGP